MPETTTESGYANTTERPAVSRSECGSAAFYGGKSCAFNIPHKRRDLLRPNQRVVQLRLHSLQTRPQQHDTVAQIEKIGRIGM